MSAPFYPPAPTPQPMQSPKAPGTGWVAVVAGVIALVAAFLPWYQPRLTGPINTGGIQISAYHSWSGFFFLIAAPLVLVVFGLMWLQALRGRTNSRFAGAADPVRALAVQSIVMGVVAAALGALSSVLVKSHYKGWDEVASSAKQAGGSLSKGPQIGLYLLFVAALLMIVAGALGLVVKGVPSDPTAFGQPQFGQPQQFGGPPPQFQPPTNHGYGEPQPPQPNPYPSSN
jgi:hypothetical protein